jgi:hypothetical protein
LGATVLVAVAGIAEPLAADVARVRLLAGVDATVLFTTAGLAEPLAADVARERLLAGVDATVFAAVARRAEPLAADVARERLLAGVDAFVPLQIRPAITAVLAAQFTPEPASEFSFAVLVSVLKCACVEKEERGAHDLDYKSGNVHLHHHSNTQSFME